MRLRGGYDVRLVGKPSGDVEVLPEPEALHLPLASRRFSFVDVVVKEGERVRPGQVLARDPVNHSVPLLAPRAGTVRLELPKDGEDAKGRFPGRPVGGRLFITLDDIAKEPEEEYSAEENAAKVPPGRGEGAATRLKLLELGAWQFVSDAHTGELPDPFGAPRAVIVSMLNLEPFVARGDAQVRRRVPAFTRGLDGLYSVAGCEELFLVIPAKRSDVADRVRESVGGRRSGNVGLEIVDVPARYPFDHPAVLARSLGLKKEADDPVWAVGVAGVLAVDRALTLSRPCTVRIVSLGGPAVDSPKHLKAMPGYPLEDILRPRVFGGPRRVLCGGALTGTALGDELGDEQAGLDAECEGLTVVPEHTQREMLGFMRPGFFRRSFSRCFLSSLRPAFSEKLTTAVRGERRPCVSCGFCEDVCPAGIMPHLIHKYLYKDDIDGAERARIDLCVECGLCSYVCPAKIELREQFIEAKETIRQELRAEEVTA